MPHVCNGEFYPSPVVGDSIRLLERNWMGWRTRAVITREHYGNLYWFESDVGSIRVDEFEVIG